MKPTCRQSTRDLFTACSSSSVITSLCHIWRNALRHVIRLTPSTCSVRQNQSFQCIRDTVYCPVFDTCTSCVNTMWFHTYSAHVIFSRAWLKIILCRKVCSLSLMICHSRTWCLIRTHRDLNFYLLHFLIVSLDFFSIISSLYSDDHSLDSRIAERSVRLIIHSSLTDFVRTSFCWVYTSNEDVTTKYRKSDLTTAHIELILKREVSAVPVYHCKFYVKLISHSNNGDSESFTSTTYYCYSSSYCVF